MSVESLGLSSGGLSVEFVDFFEREVRCLVNAEPGEDPSYSDTAEPDVEDVDSNSSDEVGSGVTCEETEQEFSISKDPRDRS